MGAFVTLFNYIGYRLLDAPWHLSQAVVGLLSVGLPHRLLEFA
ncbi:Inner membrane transport protein ynfM [Pantoea agglomerans]|uniref:Inner membrane transport protein ynfM n=1 Tax=Enterobacter agglomerans TaxID=549 RepID=A0A379AGR8_ENTAG|nr:Inner membrane transport protein ynfM [Pantoea agglomerans]